VKIGLTSASVDFDELKKVK